MSLLSAFARLFFLDLDLERKGCLTALVWGALVIALNSFSSVAGFEVLQEVATKLGLDGENLWGGLALVIGFSQLGGLLTQVRLWRMCNALLGFAFWTTIIAAFVLAHPRTSTWATFGLFAWSHAALFYQLRTRRRS